MLDWLFPTDGLCPPEDDEAEDIPFPTAKVAKRLLNQVFDQPFNWTLLNGQPFNFKAG